MESHSDSHYVSIIIMLAISRAINIIAGDKLYAEHTVEATTFSATQSQAGCTGNADDDVWFKFTANRTNYVLDVTPEDYSLYAVGFIYELFSGSCGSLEIGRASCRERV